MKKSNFYLLLSLAMVFLMASCSHTSQMSRIQPGRLQYAQSVPQEQPQQEMAKANVNETPVAVTAPEQNKVNSPLLTKSKPASSHKPAAMKFVEKKAAKTIAKVQDKVANTKLIKKTTASVQKAQLERRLTIAIVLIVIGVVLGAAPFGYGLLQLIGWIMVLVGVIFLLVWLLDAL